MAPLLRYIECRLNNWFSKINGVMTSSSYKSRRKIGGGGGMGVCMYVFISAATSALRKCLGFSMLLLIPEHQLATGSPNV